jgi:hypothetical protein
LPLRLLLLLLLPPPLLLLLLLQLLLLLLLLPLLLLLLLLLPLRHLSLLRHLSPLTRLLLLLHGAVPSRCLTHRSQAVGGRIHQNSGRGRTICPWHCSCSPCDTFSGKACKPLSVRGCRLIVRSTSAAAV